MAIRLLGYSGLPKEDIANIKYLLSERNIQYYETPPGNWGASMAALWVYTEDAYIDALQIINNYQKETDKEQKQIVKTEKYMKPFYWFILIIILSVLIAGFLNLF